MWIVNAWLIRFCRVSERGRPRRFHSTAAQDAVELSPIISRGGRDTLYMSCRIYGYLRVYVENSEHAVRCFVILSEICYNVTLAYF